MNVLPASDVALCDRCFRARSAATTGIKHCPKYIPKVAASSSRACRSSTGLSRAIRSFSHTNCRLHDTEPSLLAFEPFKLASKKRCIYKMSYLLTCSGSDRSNESDFTRFAINLSRVMSEFKEIRSRETTDVNVCR